MDYLAGRASHVDNYLTEAVINYRPQGLIWDRIFPIVPVAKQNDSFLVWTQGDLLRRPNTRRSPKSESNIVDFTASSLSYYCENYALKGQIADETRANADPVFGLNNDVSLGRRIVDLLNLDAEARIATRVRATANVGSSANTASSWTDFSGRAPIDDVLTGLRNVEDATGYRPNRAVFSRTAWEYFSLNQNVINAGFLGGNAQVLPNISPDRAAALLGLEQVLVGTAYVNSNEEGAALNLQSVWGDDVLLYYAPAQPSREVPSFGYAPRWRVPGIPEFSVMRLPYDAKRHMQEIEVMYWQDELITSAPLSFLITNVLSSS